jgi:hypothetical protein
MIVERHVSPDAKLTFLVDQNPDDISIGFEGMSWHTHGDILARLGGTSVEAAVEKFVKQLLTGQTIIAVIFKDGAISDAWVSDDPTKDAAFSEPGEELRFRYWDGTEVSEGG